MKLPDAIYLAAARVASWGSTCVRRKVGAVLWSPQMNGLVNGGHNTERGTTPRGLRLSCGGGDCPRGLLSSVQLAPYDGGYSNCIADHAEVVTLRDFIGRDFTGWALYVTDKPCDDCAEYIGEHAPGLRVVWPEGEMHENLR